MNVRPVVYLASDQFNRYRPEISHTSLDLDLFRDYRAIPGKPNSVRKTTNWDFNGQIGSESRARIGPTVVTLKGRNSVNIASCELNRGDSESQSHPLQCGKLFIQL